MSDRSKTWGSFTATVKIVHRTGVPLGIYASIVIQSNCMAKGQKRYTKVDGEAIFIDESGNPDLSSDSIELYPYYVVGFVYCQRPSQLRNDLKNLLKKVHKKKRYPPDLTELKFYLPRGKLVVQGYTHEQINVYEKYLPAIRENAIEIICSRASGVFAAVCDKNSRTQPTWTPERLGNYVFAQTLVRDVMNNISPSYLPSILYDKGRLTLDRTKKFEDYISNKDLYFERIGIKSYKGQIPVPLEQSSHMEPGIWAADIVAGSFECKYKHNEPGYSYLLREKYIASGERLYWPKEEGNGSVN